MFPLRLCLGRPFVTCVVTALLALHAWLAVSATVNLGVTGDETVHLTGGYSYWRFNDYRLHPENGNLPQRWAALPLLASQPTLEPERLPDLWSRSDVWQIGYNFFFESGNSIDYLLLCARSMMVVWSVATGLLVFFWSRSIWGDSGGLFSLFMFAVSPTTLAHGALVTSDMCATFCLLAATGAWWRLTSQYTAGRLLLSLSATSLAVVAKFSCVLLVPIFALICLWRLVFCTESPVREASRPPAAIARTRTAKIGSFLFLGLLHFGAATLLVWASFGFRYSGFAPDLPPGQSFFASSDGILPPSGMFRWFMVHARNLHLLPEAFLQGFAYVVYAARERGSFLAGEYGSTGWWWYFPFAFFVKSSIAELLAVVGLPVLVALHWLRNRTKFAGRMESLGPLLIFAVVYGAVSLASHLNIGQRHILPLYPIVFILIGALVAKPVPGVIASGDLKITASPPPEPAGLFAPRRPRHLLRGVILPVTICIVAGIEMVSIRPDYLAFFNQLAGGPDAGWRLLGDSSLDWGQNLPKLSGWLQTNQRPGEIVYVSNFGADDPFYQGIKGTELAPYYSFGRKLTWAPLEAGLYCIGTSMLQDASSPFRGPWTRGREAYYQRLKAVVNREIEQGLRSPIYGVGVSNDTELVALDRARFARLCMLLRARSPDATIGHSIHVYRLTSEEVRRAVDGSLEELIDGMEKAASAAPAHGS